MLKDDKYIEFGPNMLNLVKNCNHMSTGGKLRIQTNDVDFNRSKDKSAPTTQQRF